MAYVGLVGFEMVRGWVRGQVRPGSIPRGSSGAAADELVDGYDLTVEVLGSRARKPGSGSLAFAYLFRRFGPPLWGSDDYKELCAYKLRTPDPQVWLVIRPSSCALALKIAYLAHPDIQNAVHAPSREWGQKRHEWLVRRLAPQFGLDPEGDYPRDDPRVVQFREAYDNAVIDLRHEILAEIGPPPMMGVPRSKETKKHRFGRPLWRKGSLLAQRVNGALYAALDDLLRPVNIHDVLINILGHEERTFRGRLAPPFRFAGYGCEVNR